MFIFNPTTAKIEFKRILWTEIETTIIYTMHLLEDNFIINHGALEVLDDGYLMISGEMEITD